LLLDSLLPRDLTRVGGLRRMSRAVQDCAVTTMLCLKQLGLNRDVAFLIVTWTIWQQTDSSHCVAVTKDVDLSDEKRFEDVVQTVVKRLFFNCCQDISIGRLLLMGPKEASFGEFNAFATMEGWKPNRVSPEWVFDLECTLRVQTRVCYLLYAGQVSRMWRLIVSFEEDYDAEDEAAEEYCVLLLPGGKHAMERLQDRHVCPAYSTLFRAVVNLWHNFYCVIERGVYVGPSRMVVGADLFVEGVQLWEVQSRELSALRYRICDRYGRRRCFVVEEGSRLFLVPSVERENEPYAFVTLHELVKHYRRELRWVQSDTGAVLQDWASLLNRKFN
jgi:hypothetical protein